MARAMAPKNLTPAVAYCRTSSAANLGPDKDSLARRRAAVAAYAEARRLEVVRGFRDEAVSGADPIDRRPGFVEMLGCLHADGGARVILVETAGRFARDLAVQLAGHDLLKAQGVELVPVDAPDHFADDTPTAVMVRQIPGAVAEFEKASPVLKLRGARGRRSAAQGCRVEGRKGYAATAPALVRAAKRLARRSPRTGKKRSLRAIAGELAGLGFLNGKGRTFAAAQIARLLGG